MAKNLLVVESPAKAKTINKYLGKDFTVLASYGHVRDLVPKEGAVDPEHGFAMRYETIDRNQKHVDAIAKAAKAADAIYLATDPDREGPVEIEGAQEGGIVKVDGPWRADYRIEHAQHLNPDLIKRFAASGVIALTGRPDGPPLVPLQTRQRTSEPLYCTVERLTLFEERAVSRIGRQ